MRPIRRIVGVMVLGTLAVSLGAFAQAPRKELVVIDAADAEFKQIAPGMKKKVLWGNHEKGPYAAFTRLDPGLAFGVHTHSSEVRLVVLQGAYLYRPHKGKERRFGPGTFLWLPRGDVHASAADSKEGALLYEESSGGYDMKPFAEPPKGRR
jgi:quercetin dioxygenase-like cupin family protein